MKPRTILSIILGVFGIFLTVLFPGLSQAKDVELSSNSSNNSSQDSSHLRYHVAVLDFNHVATPFIVSMCVVLASAAKIGFHLNNKLSSIFPESCLLIVVGVIVGAIFWASGVDVYTLDAHTFFLFLLPPIVLDAGYFMPSRAFFDNIGTILVYAVIGTLFNTLCIGLTMWGLTHALWKPGACLLHCLVFSALISAVDPVAVLSVFEEVHVNEILHIIVFGESLLNDGVTVVLYHMFDTYSSIGEDNIEAVDIVSGVGSFFVVALGGTAIGVVYGLFTALISRFTDHVRVIEPLLVFLMGYLSYLTAEMFHLSGILSCTFCAISMKKYVEANISQKSHTTIKYFMKMLASVCETIIFILLGVSTVNSAHTWETGFVLVALLACLIFRTLGVLFLTSLVNRLRLIKLCYVDQFIMSYGGLRGAIAFSLVVLLNEDIYPQKDLFVTTTVVIIFFTVFVQGSTIKPLVNILRVKRADPHKPSMNEQIHDRMLDHLMAGVEDVTGFFGHHELRERFELINSKYLKPILVRQQSLRKRGMSIVNVYQKLAEKDAREMISNGSLSKLNSHHLSHSMADHLAYSHLQGSESRLDTQLNNLPFYDRYSSTQLDLQAHAATDTRKMRDDGKTHHIVMDAMFHPRPKFDRHRRHMLPDNDVKDVPPFHHKARMHLRHILNHHHHKSHNGNGHSITNGNDNGKPRKNVSFGKVTEVCSDMEMDRRSDLADIETGSSHSLPPSRVSSSSSTNSDNGGGIMFTVTSEHEVIDGDVLPEEPVVPTAVEISLPWKRNTGRGPLSSSFTHSLPDDHHPLIGEAPSWVNNSDYTSASQVVIPDLMHEDNEDNANANVTLDTTLTYMADKESVDLVTAADEDEVCLPLPWRCNNNDEVAISMEHGELVESRSQPATPEVAINMVDTSEDVLPPPWRTNGHSEISDCNNASEDVIPPPWRSNGHSEVSLDTNNHRHSPTDHDDMDGIPPPPWRQTAENQPIRSPSLAQDLESYSMRPQPSCQSFRISEAESRHSEPHPVHHMIEKPHRMNTPIDFDDHDGGNGGLDIPDGEPDMIETNDRIFKWLMSCEPEVFPVDDVDISELEDCDRPAAEERHPGPWDQVGNEDKKVKTFPWSSESCREELLHHDAYTEGSNICEATPQTAFLGGRHHSSYPDAEEDTKL